MSKINQHYLKLQESGLLPDVEYTYPPDKNAYCEEGESWLDQREKEDKEYQMRNEDERI